MSYLKLFFLLFIFSSTLFSKELEKVSLQLNWKFQYEFAGFIAAYEKGFYKEAGFDVELMEFSRGVNVVDLVKGGKRTFGIYDSSILHNYDKKKPLILLANYFKRSPLVFVTKQDIFTPTDLKGKDVMALKDELLHSSLAKLLKKFEIRNSDFNHIPHNFTAKDFIEGKVDVMSAFISNQLYDINKAGVPYNIIDPTNYEINDFGMNLFTSLDYVKKNSQKVEKFIAATNKGWEYALENKSEIVDIIYNKYSKLKSKDALMYEAKQTEKLVMKHVYPLGEIKKSFIKEKFEYEKSLGTIEHNLTLDDLIFSLSRYYKKYDFSEDEVRYLANKNEIKLCIDPNWMPFEKIDTNGYTGMSKDYFELFEKELSIPINLVRTKTWEESLSGIKNGRCDILSLVMQTEDRRRFINVTKPYIEVPFVIATKTEKLFVNSLSDVITNKKIGVVKSYAYLEILKKRFPKNMLVEVDSVDDGLRRVSRGELFGFVDNIITIGYKIQNRYIGELKIAGKFDDIQELGVGVNVNDPVLLSIFDKVISKVDDSLKQNILNRWVNIKYERSFDYALLFKIVVVFIVLILAVIYRYKEVIKYNSKIKKQQEELEKKNKELKENQYKLRDSLHNFEILLDSTMEGVFIFDEHICIGLNKSGANILGYGSKEEALGKDLYSHLDEDNLAKLKDKINKGLESFELEFMRRDKTTFPALVRDSYIRHNNKRVKLITLIDLTDMKNKEKLFLAQSKLASMGEMIGNIAHQWRQPLSLISTVSTGLKMKLENDIFFKEDAVENLDKLNSTAQHLSQTIDDFRNFFKTDKKEEEFCIYELINHNMSLLDSLFRNNYIKTVINIEENIFLNTYKNELTQALLNILNNASDALKERDDEERYVFINIFSKDSKVIIKIKDSAGGIDKDIIEKVFEPYFTTKHKSQGTGIGLYMTHQIVCEHMGGKISVENVKFIHNDREFKGAEFTIKLDAYL